MRGLSFTFYGQLFLERSTFGSLRSGKGSSRQLSRQLAFFTDTRCPNISLAAVQILRCKTNWESMGARRRTKTATYTGMIVVPLGILLGWISCSGGAPQLKRLITATSLFYLTRKDLNSRQQEAKIARRGPDSERIMHLGNQNGTFTR